MNLNTAAHFQPPELRPYRPCERLPYFILPACIFFNFILCFLNTNAFNISLSVIISCEVVLIGLSTLYGFFRLDQAKLYWLVVMVVQLVLMLLLSFARDEFLMKPIRDMIMMPVFIMLGLSSARLNPKALLFWVCGVITVFMVYEAFFVESFTHYFNILQYYIGKGVLTEETFSPLSLSASGIRPNERFLIDLPGIHRISSVFLEPVSLGFFAYVVGLYFLAVKNDISKKAYIAGILTAYIFIWFSDARMAFGALTIMLLGRPMFARLDHRVSALVFPTVFVIGLIIYITSVFGTTGEGIGWRIDDTMKKLSEVSFDLLIGMSTATHFAEDSGLLKILQYQGFLGFMMYWLAPIFFCRKMPAQPTIYLFGITLFLSFGFLLSAAILTIKTAAMLWFLYGYLIARYVTDKQEMP